MCGIAGIRRFDGTPISPSQLEAMGHALEHRGPDSGGTLIRGDVGFAHRRLSIIDLGGSPQPMSTSNERVHVCFNGEILNYRELRDETPFPYGTSGDTEVLLANFVRNGPMGVDKLKGQFAYAIFDEESDDLWLYRDYVGILPLYYYYDGSQLLFASEIKAILAALPQRPPVDSSSLVQYLQHRYVPAAATMFEGIKKLPAGCCLRVRATGPDAPVPYWRIGQEGQVQPGGETAVTEDLRTILEQSITRNLVADVPVGAYLSGGVDSSLIVGLASGQVPTGQLLTFSAGFGAGSLDELPFAREVSQHFRTRHHEVMVGADDFSQLWGPLTWHRDAPISEASDIAVYRLAELAAEHVKVVLSGEGSDELFGGYPKHRFASATRAAGLVPSAFRRRSLDLVQSRMPADLWRLRIAVRALSAQSEADRYAAWFSSFTHAEAMKLMRSPVSDTVSPQLDLRQHGDALRRMLVVDTSAWLPDNLLERADRMSMAASLETRPPFLDRDVVEFAFRLPSEYKVRHRQGKWVVKQVARNLLPSSIVDRQKAGFRAPLAAWFRTGLREMAWGRLLDRTSFVTQILDRDAVESLLRRHDSGDADEANRIWNLVALELWHEVCYRGENVAAVGTRSTPGGL